MKSSIIYIQIYIFICLIISVTSCSDKTKSTTYQKGNTKTDTPLKTNPQIAEYIRNIFQDKNGDLWFGTNSYGVAHLLNDSIIYFSNKQGFGGEQVTGMAKDSIGNIWFSTNQGIVKYDWSATKNGEKIFANFKVDEDLDKSNARCIFVDSKNNVWAGTSKGVKRFDGKSFKSFELPFSKEEDDDKYYNNRTIWSISEDKKGNLWFGTNGNGAFKYDGKTFNQYTKKDGLTGNEVDCILEDSKGNIWFGTRWNGISCYNGKTFTSYAQHNSIIGNNEVCVIYEDKVGNIWFSSEGYGLYRFNGISFTNYAEAQGLGVRAVQTIFEDKEGRFWVGGGGGLYRFNGSFFFNVTKNGPWE